MHNITWNKSSDKVASKLYDTYWKMSYLVVDRGQELTFTPFPAASISIQTWKNLKCDGILTQWLLGGLNNIFRKVSFSVILVIDGWNIGH